MISISMSQFISISTKQGYEALKTQVDKIKDQKYSPGMDYWKPIRDELSKVLKGEHTFDSFNSIVENATVKHNKRENYHKAVSKLKNFFSHHSYECLDNHHTKTFWYYPKGDLQVRVAPEFNIKIDSQKYFLRVHYRLKKENERMTMTTVGPSLLLLDKATRNVRDADTKVAFLNLQNQKLITLDDVKDKYKSNDSLIAMAAIIYALYTR